MFGSGISPLPTTTPESFSTRIGYVLLAVGYTLCMMALLWPRERSVSTQLSLRSIRRAATRRRAPRQLRFPSVGHALRLTDKLLGISGVEWRTGELARLPTLPRIPSNRLKTELEAGVTIIPSVR